MIIKDDPDIIKGYLEDNSGLRGGYAREVLLPQNPDEVSSALRRLNKERVPVTIAGNGTGIAGGRVPFGGVVLSTEKLKRIIEVRRRADKSGLLRTQAGVTLKEIKVAADKEGLFYRPDPTEDTACIGGNVATNASGARSYRYGSTRRHVTGLKVVSAEGRIFDIRRGALRAEGRVFDLSRYGLGQARLNLPAYTMPSIKSSAGYYIHDGMDLVDLFIGQEGTLGVIIEAELSLIQKEGAILSFLAFFKQDTDALHFVSVLKEEGVLSIEYFDVNSLSLLRKLFAFIPRSGAGVFFEKEAGDEGRTTESISNLLDKHNAISDKTLFAQNEKEYKKLQEIRHALPETINEIIKKNAFPKVGTDIAVPEKAFPKMFKLYKSRLKECGVPYVIFGHIGQCHLHVNMLPSSEEMHKKTGELYAEFVNAAIGLGGTVSAEHGIGKLRHAYLEKMYGHKGIMEMAALKKALDPNCILGIGNIFPKELLYRL